MPGACPLCPAPCSRGARRVDTQRLLPRDPSPLLVALAPPQWCGGGVFCCSPRSYSRVRGTVTRSLSPSLEMPALFGRQTPFLACHSAAHVAFCASAFKKHGLLRKKAHSFRRKVPGFRANTTTFHENKQRAKEKAVKRNFKSPSADKDMPQFPLISRSVVVRNSPLSSTERARIVAVRALFPKRHRANAHTPPIFPLSLLTPPKNQ